MYPEMPYAHNSIHFLSLSLSLFRLPSIGSGCSFISSQFLFFPELPPLANFIMNIIVFTGLIFSLIFIHHSRNKQKKKKKQGMGCNFSPSLDSGQSMASYHICLLSRDSSRSQGLTHCSLITPLLSHFRSHKPR